MRFTHDVCKEIAQVISNALVPVAEQFGINIKLGRGTFSANNYTLKIEMACVDPSGTILSRERDDWNYSAVAYGLNPEWLDRTFDNGQSVYRISGLKPRSRKYPVLAEDTHTGKMYKFSARAIRMHMMTKPKENQ